MTISSNLLEILVCPENKSPLRLAGQSTIQELNLQIAAGTLFNREGQPVAEKIESGLIREDGRVLYPVRNDIPIMLIEEGIMIKE